jgi:hypothetical protein
MEIFASPFPSFLLFILCLDPMQRRAAIPASPLKKRIVRPGDERTFPEKGSRVVIRISVVDNSTIKRVGPSHVASASPILQFSIGENIVLSDFDDSVASMSVQEEAIIALPAEKAYRDIGIAGYLLADRNMFLKITLLFILPFKQTLPSFVVTNQ